MVVYVQGMPIPENPFPGMNPFLELRWSDAHLALICYITDALSEVLPPDLSIRVEEQLAVDTPAEPGIVYREPDRERGLAIRDLDQTLVTVLELLKPQNKTGIGREDYQNHRRVYRDAGVNLVEIDLLRGGSHTVAVDPALLPEQPGTHTIVCVTRLQDSHQHEVYRCPLRDRLPAFRVPLRSTDPDVPLDLQPLIDRCYRTGRYWQISDPAKLVPALPEEELSWVVERVTAG